MDKKINMKTIGDAFEVMKDMKYPSFAASVPLEIMYTDRYFRIHPPITE